MKILKQTLVSKILVVALAVTLTVSMTACGGGSTGSSKTVVFADADWDSIKFHNKVAMFILENGYGIETDSKVGSTAITFTGLRNGDIDVYMEAWSDNLDFYDEAIESGEVIEVSTNFNDNAQGLYIPTYVIKGDEKRGIKPVAPDLKNVKDLDKYKDIFKDPEEPEKGRIYGSIAGWQADNYLYNKYKAYGLDKNYNYMRPGSESALSASIASAYEKGEPWVGYYWEPTWIIGKYDMTLLQDEEFSEEKWEKGECEFPPVKVTVCINKDLEKDAPEVVEFLKNYETSSAITSKALAYMIDNKTTHEDTATWFLKNYKDTWKTWVSDEIAQKVEKALN